MSSSTDHAFIATQTAALLRPLVASTSSVPIPAPLLAAVNASLSRDLKLKLAPSAVRQAIDQLGELRGRKWRAGEKREERERRGRVVVRKGGDAWLEDLGRAREWPVAKGEEGEGEEERERYSELLRRVEKLRKKKARVEAQLAHYQKLETLAASITPDAVQDHTLEDPDSAIRTALNQMEQLLPASSEHLEENADDVVMTKRTKVAQYGPGGELEAKAAGVAAGAALTTMLNS